VNLYLCPERLVLGEERKGGGKSVRVWEKVEKSKSI